MTVLNTDRIWATRPGFTPPAGDASNFVTISDIAGGLPVASVDPAAIQDLAGAITAGETMFAPTSTDNTVAITTGGTNGHTPDFAVNWSAITAAGAAAIVGAIAINGISPSMVNFAGADGLSLIHI